MHENTVPSIESTFQVQLVCVLWLCIHSTAYSFNIEYIFPTGCQVPPGNMCPAYLYILSMCKLGSSSALVICTAAPGLPTGLPPTSSHQFPLGAQTLYTHPVE